MGVNSELVKLLNASEQRDFIRYLTKRNKRNDTRNTDLFKALLKGKESSIKAEIGQNAFNVLNKRLSDRLLDYMAVGMLETHATKEIDILKQLLVARKLIAHRQFKLAFRLLKKAEERAEEIKDYALLNDIYQTLVEYSYHHLAPDQELIFRNHAKYREEFLHQERLNMAYAAVRKAFQNAQTENLEIDLEVLLRENYERFGVSKEQGYNFQTLYQLTQIADIAGSHSRDYHSIDLFFLDQLKSLKGGVLDNEKYLIYHIDVLYLIANIYFRKKDFSRSLLFLEDVYEQMQRYEKRFYKEREVRYLTLLALNYNFTDHHVEALQALEPLLDRSDLSHKELLNPMLVLVMIYFQQNELEKAYKLLTKFQQSDGWYDKAIGREWNLQKRYIEILLHIELGNIDYVDACINSFTRKYGNHFKSAGDTNVLPFLKLVKRYYHDPEIIHTEQFKERVEGSIVWKDKAQEDIFLMCFYAWLKSKMEKRPLYSTTLELIHN